MVRTRKRLYGEELSQSSSNIAYADRSRLKQFDQQEGKRQKRQKKSKESSFFTFDMSNKNCELLRLLSQHNATYVGLLEQVCNGQDRTMGNCKGNTSKNDLFWRNFAHTFCQKSGLENKEGMHIACQHYCDDLKLGYKHMKKTSSHSNSNYWGQLTRIFDSSTPSTSTGRSSQSRRLDSQSYVSGHIKKLELYDALAELAHSGDLDFNAIERVEQYVSKSKAGLHTFVRGTKEYRTSVVRKYLGTDSQETAIPDSMRP